MKTWCSMTIAGLLFFVSFGIAKQGACKSPAAKTPTAATAEVYLLAGQSNMQGLGQIKKLSPKQKGPIKNVKYWNGKAFVPLVVGKTRTSSRKSEFGPEVGFAQAISKARPGKTIYIIKFHRSGQPLHHGWNGNKWVGGKPAPKRRTFYPGQKDGDPNVGLHYKAMIAQSRKALASLKAKKISYRFAGVAWMQGEQDSKHKVSADAYADSLRHFKQRIEQDLNAGKAAPLVFGQVLPHTPAKERFVARKLIRQRMAEADHASGHKNAIPGVKMVSTDNMPLRSDTVHYNTAGQLQLGTAFAKAMCEMQAKK